MTPDQDTLQYLWGLIALPVSYVGKLMWSNHKSIQEIREDIARDYPTWKDMHKELAECSDAKDKMLDEQRDDLKYIRDRVDKLVDRELNKKD